MTPRIEPIDYAAPIDCEECEQTHERCKGHVDGRPCKKRRMRLQLVCGSHGGRSPQAKKAAERRQSERLATKALESFGVPIPTDPHTALLDELYRSNGVVIWLGAIVADLEREEIAWGRTREKTGGEDHGTTHEAGRNVWVKYWQDERKHLVHVAGECVKAGIEERRIRLAEEQGRTLAGVIGRVLAGMYDALVVALGEHHAAKIVVESAWPQLVGQIVPAELRAVPGAGMGEQVAS